MSDTNFQRLPADVVYLILSHTSDIQSLLAFASATSAIFSVYRDTKHALFRTIFRHKIPRAVLPTAWYVHQIRPWKRDDIHFQPALNIVEAGIRSQSYDATWLQKSSGDALRDMLRYDQTVDRFIADFVVSSHALISQSLSQDQSQWKAVHRPPFNASMNVDISLSHAEYVRLKRAFYNLEVCGFLYSAIIPHRGIHHPATKDGSSDILSHYIRSLPLFECREMMCVAQYLQERLLMFIDDLGDDFIQRLMDKKRHLNPPPTRVSVIDRFEYIDDFLFARQARYRLVVWLESRLARGLGDSWSLLTAKTYEEKVAAVGVVQYKQIPLRALLDFHAYIDPEDIALRTGLFHSGNDPNLVNLALERLKYVIQEDRTWKFPNWCVTDPIIGRLERWGFAIWDFSTLDRLEIPLHAWDKLSQMCSSPYKSIEDITTLEERVTDLWKTFEQQGLVFDCTSEEEFDEYWIDLPAWDESGQSDLA